MKSSSRPDLSIVIPAYREERRLGSSLEELAVFLRTDELLKTTRVEVIVVAADAPDATHRVAQSKKQLFDDFTLLRPGPKVGKGRDVQYGMLRAHGKAVLFMDADLATPLRHLPQFYQAFLKGAPVVIAVRNLRKHHSSMIRRVVSNAGNILFRIAGGVWVEDSQCGFKLFSYEATQICFSKLSILGWGFDMEVLAIAKANKLKIKSYRVNDWRSVEDGTFVDGVVENSIKSLLELLFIARGRLSGRYRKR